MYKYRVKAGYFSMPIYDEPEVNVVANVWVLARSKSEALKKAVSKIVRESKNEIRKEDLEYLEAIKISNQMYEKRMQQRKTIK